MGFTAEVFDEPELLFGDGRKHIDPRDGLRRFGPLQPVPGEVVSIGIVGSSKTCEGFEAYLEVAQTGIPSERGELPNLNSDFPGLGNANPFSARFTVQEGGRRELSRRQIREIVTAGDPRRAIHALIDLIEAEIETLREGPARPDVVVFAMPAELIEAVHLLHDAPADEDDDGGGVTLDFRDLLKARMMARGVVTQIVWPDVYDPDARIPRKIKKHKDRTLQAPATRAWNLFNKLLYKSGRVPWKLFEDREYTTNFLGIGFHRSVDGQQM